jgi:membrane protease YdiL (CAAX protease family)
VLFGLVHIIGYPLITVPVKMLFGILVCLLYERTGSLLPGIAVHSFVDASAIDLALTGNDDIGVACFGALIVILVLRWAFQSLTRPLLTTAADAPA